MKKQPAQSDFAMIGLGVMGAALARNVESRGFRVSVFNRSRGKTDTFMKTYGNGNFVAPKTYKALVASLSRPRKLMILVKAGAPVDGVIKDILPFLEKGDVLIDGGNSHYKDTQRRMTELKKKGIHYLGCGVSGGEEGALHGPSLMPGGSKAGYRSAQRIFKAIAAQDFSGEPCVTYVGDNGAGHYVKMVHNGIEYGIMQLMAETYALLRKVYKLPAATIGDMFERMNKGKLQSFLFEIAVPVLHKKDEKKGSCCLIYQILDKAGNKGTGKWASMDGLDRGVAVPTITQAVYARYISAEKKERTVLNKRYQHQHRKQIALRRFIRILDDALYAAIISTFAQGFDLMQKAAEEEQWDIDLAEISRIWEGGCIIRAKLLNVLHTGYASSKNRKKHVFAVPSIETLMKKHVSALRSLVASSTQTQIVTPGFSSALYYFEAMVEERLPANFIQGLRDYFGAHTFERVDEKGSFHADW